MHAIIMDIKAMPVQKSIQLQNEESKPMSSLYAKIYLSPGVMIGSLTKELLHTLRHVVLY